VRWLLVTMRTVPLSGFTLSAWGWRLKIGPKANGIARSVHSWKRLPDDILPRSVCLNCIFCGPKSACTLLWQAESKTVSWHLLVPRAAYEPLCLQHIPVCVLTTTYDTIQRAFWLRYCRSLDVSDTRMHWSAESGNMPGLWRCCDTVCSHASLC